MCFTDARVESYNSLPKPQIILDSLQKLQSSSCSPKMKSYLYVNNLNLNGLKSTKTLYPKELKAFAF